jgi:hypothetical protein
MVCFRATLFRSGNTHVYFGNINQMVNFFFCLYGLSKKWVYNLEYSEFGNNIG